MEEVKRFGTGGRLDPYIYKVCNSTFHILCCDMMLFD